MSDWSDTSEAADSDTSCCTPRFSRPRGEEQEAAAVPRATRQDSSKWMWYYNLSEKQRRAEDERIANKLAAVEAEFREVEKFELTYVPFEYRTRGSSLSPRTPPPKEPCTSASDAVSASPLPSTSNAGLPEPPCEAQPDGRRVKFRLADGSVVSSSDDEDTFVSRVSRKRFVHSSNDAAESPPKASEGRALEDISSDDDDGASASGRVARLSKVRETPGALPRSIPEEDVDRESGGDASSSSSLTRADVIRKRKERIDRQRSLIEDICSGHRSSSDESSRKRSFLRTPVVTPTHRSVAGRQSHVRRTLWAQDDRATPSPTSSVEEPLRVLEWGQTPPSFWLSSASSATSSIAGPPAKTSRVWHSTPHGAPRSKFASLRDIRASGSAPLRGTFATEASADRPQRAGRGFQVLDRGQTLVVTKLPESQEVTCFGEQPPTEPPSAAPSPASQRHDEGSTTQRSVDAAEWSTVIRFGVGGNRERVLLSDAPTPLSAIASFGAQSRSRTSQAPQDPRHEQGEPAPAARDDSQPVSLLQQLLKHCQQEAPVTFEQALRLTDDCRRCLKLGEGCTADVYRIRRPSGDESAVKVIPVGGGPNENGELPMSLSSVILECVMTRELSNLRYNETNQSATFIELKRIYCVQGTYHPILLKSWRDYDNQFCSENSDPGKCTYCCLLFCSSCGN
ncbi:uncharacterized protein LOC119455798 [Dermacentor silvarum]|uniref:uncharacterized protein LOC119455798 n=1 Tax=Dermacentor silvarum TaxID=543639 RepID=UPI002100E96B|nr:uncharacterized protein LOC119455798 [Dermacentor silvarum]